MANKKTFWISLTAAFSLLLGAAAPAAVLAQESAPDGQLPPETAVLEEQEAFVRWYEEIYAPRVQEQQNSPEEIPVDPAEEDRLMDVTRRLNEQKAQREAAAPQAENAGEAGTIAAATAWEDGVQAAAGSFTPGGDLAYEYVYNDPGGYMTDQAFFGVYDAGSGTWTTKGKFDYDKFPEMNSVKQAAMDGDYELAKENFLQYFKDKVQRNFNYNKGGSSSKSNVVISKLLEEQILYNAGSVTPADLFTIRETDTDVALDVTDIVNAAKDRATKDICMILTGLRKDGSSAEFYSKEAADAGKRPVVEVLINGVVRRYEPTGDTYIRRGGMSGTNFNTGSAQEPQPRLLVEESVSSINNTSYMTDENTKQAFMTFLFDDIADADTITSATLKMVGRNTSEQGNTGEMGLVLWYNNQTTISESDLKWNSFQHYIYNSNEYRGPDGEPLIWFMTMSDANDRYNEDILRFETFHGKPVNQFAATGDEYYGYVACKMFGDFVKRIGNDPGFRKNLDVSCRMFAIPGMLLKLLDSEHFTPDIFTAVVKFLWLNANYIKTRFTSGSNWGSVEMCALFEVGSYFNEVTDYADWVSNPNKSPNGSMSSVYRLRTMVNNTIKSDFSSTEKALGYVQMNVNLLISPSNTSKVTGVEYPYDEDTRNKITRDAVYMRDMTAPGNREIQWGDAGLYSNKYTGFFQTFVETLDEPTLRWSAYGGKQGTKPEYTSILYPTGRMLAMRTGWEEGDNYLFTSYDAGGVHAHQDDLAPIIVGKGRYLLSDQSYYAYQTATYNKLTTAELHNVLLVNGGYASGGSSADWATNNGFDFFAAKAGQYKRNILFVKPDYWIITDYLTPNNPGANNSYRQLWHMPPDANFVVDEETLSMRSQYSDVNLLITPVSPEELTFERKTGYYGGGVTTLSNADYGNYSKTQKGDGVMNTILRVEDGSNPAQIEPVSIDLPDVTDSGASAFRFRISDRDKKTDATYYIVNDEQQIKERAVGDFTYDGKLFFVQRLENGEWTETNIVRGSKLIDETNGLKLFDATEPVEELSIQYRNRSMAISGSVENLNNMIFAKQAPVIDQVTVNGVEVAFKQSESYVYFEREPGDGPLPTATPTASSPSSGGHGSSGGGGGGGSSKATPTPTATVSPVATATDLPATPTPTATPDSVLTKQMEQELSGHWGKAEITGLVEQGLVQGDDSGSLALGQQVTRAEMAVLLARAMDLKPDGSGAGFHDVDEGQWYADAALALQEAGIMEGDGNGGFSPGRMISREEMAKLVAGVYRMYDGKAIAAADYQDEEDISPWAAESIALVSGAGLMQGNEEGRFMPKAPCRRDEAMAVVYRLLERLGRLT